MIYVDKNNEKRTITDAGVRAQLEEIRDNTKIVLKRRYRKPAIRYWNIEAGFDIETTSTYIDDKKVGWMYEWTFGIGDHIYIGRRWEEYKDLIRLIDEVLGEARLFVGVHNLSFEFQFMRNYFTWSEVFSNDERHPIKAVSGNIEYRCTATISALPLKELADNLVKHKIQKLKGDLDYSVCRTYLTKLDDKELQYCINDVRIILYYINEQIEICGDISKIPMTNTGRVRQYCREHCLQVTKKNGKPGRNRKYIKAIHKQTLTPDLYLECKLAFRGGFTHANPYWNDEQVNNVTSYDLTSAYPSVMITEKYPTGEPEFVEVTEKVAANFDWYIDNRCCLFKATFVNIRPKKEAPDNYLSWISSKMEAKNRGPLNNGRITTADELTVYLTDVDYKIVRACYDFDELYINDLVLWFKNYLPKDFIKCVLKFYKDKTTLKGVKDKIIEYQAGKGMLNALYGMLVMDICKDQNEYDTDWHTEEVDLNEMIDKYNNSASRFTYYPTGLWVTAYCRKLIWDAILDLGDDYVYSDTDSIKCLGDHTEWFDNKNREIRNRVYAAMDYHKLDKAEVEPKTIKGEPKLIGLWDNEGTYDMFKTLGAKRYMTMKYDWYTTSTKSKYKPVELAIPQYELTVSGVTKRAMNYIKSFQDPFKYSIRVDW